VVNPERENGTFAYFGTWTGRVVEVDLAGFQRVGAITLGSGERQLRSAVVEPGGAHAYDGTSNEAGPGGQGRDRRPAWPAP
jgi:hypothetical protein